MAPGNWEPTLKHEDSAFLHELSGSATLSINDSHYNEVKREEKSRHAPPIAASINLNDNRQHKKCFDRVPKM